MAILKGIYLFFVVDMVVHTAGNIDSGMLSSLIHALGQRRRASGRETFFIHVSLSSNAVSFLTPFRRQS